MTQLDPPRQINQPVGDASAAHITPILNWQPAGEQGVTTHHAGSLSVALDDIALQAPSGAQIEAVPVWTCSNCHAAVAMLERWPLAFVS